MRDKTPKNSARTMIAVLLMLVATPFASFASANNTYGNFEDYCDFEFNDGQGSTYTPDDIITHSSELTIVEVEPGMYQIEFDCTSGVSSGDLEVAVDQHGGGRRGGVGPQPAGREVQLGVGLELIVAQDGLPVVEGDDCRFWAGVLEYLVEPHLTPVHPVDLGQQLAQPPG